MNKTTPIHTRCAFCPNPTVWLRTLHGGSADPYYICFDCARAGRDHNPNAVKQALRLNQPTGREAKAAGWHRWDTVLEGSR